MEELKKKKEAPPVRNEVRITEVTEKSMNKEKGT